MQFSPEERQYMRLALRLASQGLGRVEPNPMVGCIIVRDGRIIGQGYHLRFGEPHAEVMALGNCRGTARGATAFVSLEPCCHHGKTPPCTDALIAAKVKRVVAAVEDPNPAVSGKGCAELRAAGIRVDVGLLAEQAEELNAPFFKLQRTGRPWVILKWAQSLDGKIATHTGDSKWISDAACRAHAHRVRGRVDAVVVGVGTVIQDNPQLTCRYGCARRVATRVILDTHLRTPLGCQLVDSARMTPTWIFCAAGTPARKVRLFEDVGCAVHMVPKAAGGLSLPAVLDTLGCAQMTRVLIEGGATLLGRFFEEGLADEYQVYISLMLVGGRDAPNALNAGGANSIAEAVRLPSSARLRRMGTCYFVGARPVPVSPTESHP
jgi:diaminohydroxyphosphoribosylaminopyrimidine deaminase/5-amino-6-(5-phosphoribosylamino)uracil reductase